MRDSDSADEATRSIICKPCIEPGSETAPAVSEVPWAVHLSPICKLYKQGRGADRSGKVSERRPISGRRAVIVRERASCVQAWVGGYGAHGGGIRDNLGGADMDAQLRQGTESALLMLQDKDQQRNR